MQKEILLEDTIRVKELNSEGKFFESVTRLDAISQMYGISIQLDVNTDIYPVEKGSVRTLATLL